MISLISRLAKSALVLNLSLIIPMAMLFVRLLQNLQYAKLIEVGTTAKLMPLISPILLKFIWELSYKDRLPQKGKSNWVSKRQLGAANSLL